MVLPTLDMISRVATAFQTTPSSLLAQAEQIQVYAANTVTPLEPGVPRKK